MNIYSLCIVASNGAPRLWFSSIFASDAAACETARTLLRLEERVEIHRDGHAVECAAAIAA